MQCLECNKPFTSRNKNRKFCSQPCYHKQAISHKKGKESPFWRGSEAHYGSIHDWIKAQFGIATKCENPDCKYPRKSKNGIIQAPKRFDWALRKGRKYEDRKPDSFIQLCRSCHKKYDYDETKHNRYKGTYVAVS